MICIAHLPAEIHDAINRLAQDIEFTSESEKGANGYVLLGCNKILERDVAVKFYFWEGSDHAEPKLLAKLEHPNIIKVHDASEVDDDFAYFVTPLCAGGDLDTVLEARHFGLKEAIDVAMQVAAGAGFLHGNGFLHRDLKPQNIFCDNDRYMIGDFGSVVPCDEKGYAKCLTKHSLIYRPPETVQSNSYFKSSDVYQLGILLYQLLGGSLPYSERDWLTRRQQAKYDELVGFDQQDFATKIIEQRITAGRILDYASLSEVVPGSLKSIIRQCLRTKPEDRYQSCADLSAALNNLRGNVHDWVFEEHPILRKKGKMIRILDVNSKLFIEKDSGTGWRRQHALKPETMAEAYRVAEEQ
ncbi:serine/threonine-protein kinase [Ensifer sp. OV372]|uniref:serine/threonine protein kinase n=1 Tax=Ensifer sp. OV372 TaxID=1855293 RepID=UPI0008EA78BF|nr:serine/threonine-protein kinase [Ensifer sp. OV372]SFG24584.1 Serine/threonine protein kinase [Ensifer sp. OV372]